MAAGKRGRNFGHEPRHLVLDLRVRLEADIEIEDDLIKPGLFDLLQGVGYLGGRAEQDRILGQILRPHIAQPGSTIPTK